MTPMFTRTYKENITVKQFSVLKWQYITNGMFYSIKKTCPIFYLYDYVCENELFDAHKLPKGIYIFNYVASLASLWLNTTVHFLTSLYCWLSKKFHELQFALNPVLKAVLFFPLTFKFFISIMKLSSFYAFMVTHNAVCGSLWFYLFSFSGHLCCLEYLIIWKIIE